MIFPKGEFSSRISGYIELHKTALYEIAAFTGFVGIVLASGYLYSDEMFFPPRPDISCMGHATEEDQEAFIADLANMKELGISIDRQVEIIAQSCSTLIETQEFYNSEYQQD